MTTNGHRLPELAEPLARAGLREVNVSIDTLDATKFKSITRRGDVGRVVAGIEAALAAGIRVKLNAVALKGFNDDEVGALCGFAWSRNVTPRFIEHMRDLEGRNFLILENINLRESGRLRLRVTGLPERAGWQRTAPWVALGFVALFLGIAGFGALSRATSESVDDARTDDLTLRRDTLYEKLVKLEKNHRQGNVPDNRYQRTRKQLVSQLEAIYRELRDRRSGDEGVETDDPGPS